MPELPEVQTIINDLQLLTGDTITGFWTDWKKAIKETAYADFKKAITGQKIIGSHRIGKFIVIDLAKNISIIIHLRMTGQLLFTEKLESIEEKYRKHVHHIFYLQKNGILAFSDIRKFATISLFPTDKLLEFKGISILGTDALSSELNHEKLSQIIAKSSHKQIKDILMNQALIAGIGNIYASEILYIAKINPARLGGNLFPQEIKTILSSIQKILKKAILLRGTSVSDYRDSAGKKGAFQNELAVYKKHGQKCRNCDTMIEKMIIGQRSTFHCPNCQK